MVRRMKMQRPLSRSPDSATAEDRFQIGDPHGFRVDVLAYGATIAGIFAPDRDRHYANVVLHYADEAAYREQPWYLGATIGRYANRIAGGSFTLDGTVYELSKNEQGVTLHGGVNGFDKATWEVLDATPDSLVLQHVSPHGDEGFPGTLAAAVTFRIRGNDTLEIAYRATTSAPTIVNLTNHSYFNLTGDASNGIWHHLLQLHASSFTPVDARKIPTGDIEPVAATLLDYCHWREVVPMDFNFVLDEASAPRAAAELYDPTSGRALHITTTEPGIQVFSGKGNGIALETQHFPDSPHHRNFPPTVLRPGEVYETTTSYEFTQPSP